MQKKIIIGFTLTLIIVIFIPVYWAMEPARQEAALNRQHEEAVDRGAAVFTLNCASCHGSQGEGDIGPALRGTPLDDALEKIIARGVAGTAMPAWSEEEGGPLKSHQVEDLVTFIKNWGSAPPPTPAPASQTPPSAISTDELYAIRCVVCHGANREGVSGLGLPLIPGSLTELSDNEIKNTILNGRFGTAMPAFKEILSSDEIDALLHLVKYTSP
jgi:cbb3-type cytochrome c oxidase subunit III